MDANKTAAGVIAAALLGFTGVVYWQSADASKLENCPRLEQDVTGVYRAWIQIDQDHTVIAKFRDMPTQADIRAVHDKTLAQEADAKAAKDAETAKVAQSEAWKAEGRCPTCGQVLPKDGGK